MARVPVLREETFTSSHPDILHGNLVRVDHEIVDRLQRGQGFWNGDPRLCLYCNVGEDRWELWRFEADGKYRCAARSPIGMRLGEDLYNDIVTHLVQIDVRRGYDPIDDLESHETALDRALDAEFSDQVQGDIADRLHHALKKDGADKHVTGYY